MKDIQVVTGVVRVDAAQAAVKVDFMWMYPPQRSHWARIATLMSGRKRGVYYMPERRRQVLGSSTASSITHASSAFAQRMDVPPGNRSPAARDPSVNATRLPFDARAVGGDLGFVRISDAHGI
jgi:hypothetical protein